MLLIGETRDGETLDIALEAALAGHLVLSAMYTNNAASALKRMLDIGGRPFVVGSAIRIVVAQRLLRALCPDCSVKTAPGADVKDAALAMVRDSGLAWRDIPHAFRQPKGCDACNLTGFRGRILVTETMELTPEISSLLQKTSDPAALQDVAVSQGMVPLAVAALRRAGRGETSLPEVVLHCAVSVPARAGN